MREKEQVLKDLLDTKNIKITTKGNNIIVTIKFGNTKDSGYIKLQYEPETNDMYFAHEYGKNPYIPMMIKQNSTLELITKERNLIKDLLKL